MMGESRKLVEDDGKGRVQVTRPRTHLKLRLYRDWKSIWRRYALLLPSLDIDAGMVFLIRSTSFLDGQMFEPARSPRRGDV